MAMASLRIRVAVLVGLLRRCRSRRWRRASLQSISATAFAERRVPLSLLPASPISPAGRAGTRPASSGAATPIAPCACGCATASISRSACRAPRQLCPRRRRLQRQLRRRGPPLPSSQRRRRCRQHGRPDRHRLQRAPQRVQVSPEPGAELPLPAAALVGLRAAAPSRTRRAACRIIRRRLASRLRSRGPPRPTIPASCRSRHPSSARITPAGAIPAILGPGTSGLTATKRRSPGGRNGARP